MAENNILKIASKSGRKEYFNIVLYNNLSSDYVNRSLLTQEVEYRVDGEGDDEWSIFKTEYNSYINRKTVFGYYVEIKNYNTLTDINNTANSLSENSLKYNSQFTVSTDTNYDATGYIFMPGLFGIEINELDDMTANELMNEIANLKTQLNDLKNKVNNECVSVNTINLYATIDYVDTKPTSYITYSYFDSKIEGISTSPSEVSLDGYATEDWVSSAGYVTETRLEERLSSIPQGGNVDLTDFATIQYVDDSVRNAEISGGMYDDTEIREDINTIENKLDKFVLGPYAYLTNNEIGYQSLTVEDVSSLFTLNDLYEYKFKQPFLDSSMYTHELWNTYFNESPFPSWIDNKKVIFKENKDVKDFDYKINVTSSNGFNEDIHLIQKATERIYFLQGDAYGMDSYNQLQMNLDNYVLTNFENISVDVDWIILQGNNNILIKSNATSVDERTGVISFTDSKNNVSTFSIIQPGNPDYDPNSGDNPGDDQQEEITHSFLVTGFGLTDKREMIECPLDTDDILITFGATDGSITPKYFVNGTSIRMYPTNTITFKGKDDSSTITKIVFKFGTGSSATLTFDSEIAGLQEREESSQTWMGEAHEITFTVTGGTSGNLRIFEIDVTMIK